MGHLLSWKNTVRIKKNPLIYDGDGEPSSCIFTGFDMNESLHMMDCHMVSYTGFLLLRLAE